MLAYRSTFSVGGAFEQVAPAVRRVMVDWAERKHRRELGPDGLGALTPGRHLQPHPQLELLLVDSREQSEDRVFGFVVIEHDGEDAWTSQVMVASGPRLADRSLISVEIDSPASPDDPLRPRSAGVPRFVRSLLDQLDCDDHGIHLTNSPEVLGPRDVPRLRKELGEEDHHGLVLVAGTAPGLPLEQWADFIGGITRDTAAQPAVPADVTGLHARVEELTARLADRNEDLDGARKELAEARDKIRLLEQRDAKREQDDDALREELRLRTDERDELNVDYAVALDDKDRALGRAEKAEREVQRLRTVLSRIGHAEEAWDTPEEDEPDLAQPSDWLELATWAGNGELARALPRVDFTCDWDRALDLDDQNNLTWIATTWDILRALNDYGRARADESVTVRNLHEYLSAPPEGFRTVPRGRYKPTESETVENRQRYRKERTFPVPEQVPGRDDNGRLYMDRHFVIATAGIVSPRLYFHDATDVPDYGKVVVGYIGRHLTNGQTN